MNDIKVSLETLFNEVLRTSHHFDVCIHFPFGLLGYLNPQVSQQSLKALQT